MFKPTDENSELFIISTDGDYAVSKQMEKSFSLADEDNDGTPSPFFFSIGVQAEDEGAYTNALGIYLRSLDDPNGTLFFMGYININTQVVGEDERFRTLLENFGVPDPKEYSNLFAEQDCHEQGEDYTLINKKSKEMFMTYSDIFSYVGTYKALLRAIKFLGYQDIVFKEWYTFKDANDTLTDLAIQVYDTSTGEYLKNKFAQVGVSMEDFKSYNKLNKLSMVYHFNEMDEDGLDWQDVTLMQRGEDGVMRSVMDTQYLYDVPMTKPIYTYRNDEIIAKLFSVKQWLERHVIGVNAYISDITGEGIYLGIMKTQGYSTQHKLSDFSGEQYCTPTILSHTDFRGSRSKVSCTLNELNGALCIRDYYYTTFQSFEKGREALGAITTDFSIP